MKTLIYLTAEEIKQITKATRPITQTKRLRQMGFTAIERPDNFPLVSYANFLIVTGGQHNDQALQDIEPEWGAI